jgi:hypothetical protein
MVPLSVEAYTLSQIRNQEVVMAYRWLWVHLVWTSVSSNAANAPQYFT